MQHMSEKLARAMVAIHACTTQRERIQDAAEILSELDGIPKKQAYARLYNVVRHGYAEYGTSVRLAWLTPKGLAMLQDAIALKPEWFHAA